MWLERMASLSRELFVMKHFSFPFYLTAHPDLVFSPLTLGADY